MFFFHSLISTISFLSLSHFFLLFSPIFSSPLLSPLLKPWSADLGSWWITDLGHFKTQPVLILSTVLRTGWWSHGAPISAHGGATLISAHDGAPISPTKNEEMRKEMEMGLLSCWFFGVVGWISISRLRMILVDFGMNCWVLGVLFVTLYLILEWCWLLGFRWVWCGCAEGRDEF